MGKPPDGGGLFIASFLVLYSISSNAQINPEYGCPSQEKILPCRCSTRDMEYQIWCSHSELPKVLEGLKAVSLHVSRPIDELILENNNLPSLPGQAFASLRVLRLMLRNNRLERVSSGWLEGLHDSLLELFVVEPELRSLPDDSLENLLGLEAITLQSKVLKRLPSLTGLPKLRYLQVNSPALLELTPRNFRDIPNLEQIHVFGSPKLARLEAGLFRNLPRLTLVNISDCSIQWIHPRSLIDLPELKEISFIGNTILEAGMVGRAVIDLPSLSVLQLDRNRIVRLGESSFTDLPTLTRISLSKNRITEIFPGAFQRVSLLRIIDLSHNMIHRIHPEFFPHRSGSSLEELWLINNDLSHINELRSILEALPRLKFLDVSYNQLEEIPYGSFRGHPSLERLHLDHNRLKYLQRESLSGMPALRELRLRNNSLTNSLDMPFWNLPALKGLDISGNYFRHIEPRLLGNLPNLRRLDISQNAIGHIDPQSFIETSALEYVNISGNALSVIHPMTFRHLTNLFELDIGWNRLLELTPGLPRNIEHLYLTMNRLVSLPGLASQDLALPVLRTLDISANGIERILPGTLSGLVSLKKLLLGYNALRVLEDGTFDGLFRLELLDLKYNRLDTIHGRSFKPLTMLMDLNLRGNRFEIIRPDVFQENRRLQKLDISRNNLAQIPHPTFASTRDLRELYASHNTLTELPGSLHDLTALQVLDLSFNKLNILSPDTLSSLTSLLELKLVRNRIKELREGAFDGLPRLNLIDLENNDLRVIERNSIRALPELQALRLGKNRIQMIPSGAFSELPLLQSAELQENQIDEIASNAFINVPHLLFLNLSNNYLPGLDYMGLDSMRSLEVLDLSNNRISRVSNDGLAAMEWLVELKMDNNRICTIQGSPFDDMPRLRVLSLRNNKMASVAEGAFKRLRSNIAVLDIDGNPLSCSCGMIWLRGWLQQASAEGPRCADGSLFRDIRLSRQDCQRERYIESVHPGCETEIIKDFPLSDSSSLYGTQPKPWMDIKNQNGQSISQDMDYYYHDYVDYNLENTTDLSTATLYPPTLSPIVVPPSPSPELIQTTFPPKYSTIKNNTNPTKKPPTIPPSPSSSGFTFFGVPLPNLNFNLWGNAGRKANRKEDIDDRSGKIRYKNFPPTEPEIHRGGFIPIPQGEGGFIPIIDPRITQQEKREKNITVKMPKIRENTTILKSHDERIRIKHSNFTIEKIERITGFNNKKAEIKDREELSTLASVKNESIIVTTMGNFENLPITVKSTTIEEQNPEAEETSFSTEIYVGESLEVDDDDDDSSKRDVPQEKVANKIIWTTISSLDSIESDVKETVTTSMEVLNLKKKKISEIKILQKETTTIGTTEINENNFETEEPVTTDIPTPQFLSSVTTRTIDKFNSTSPASRTLEASALSALLVPGGQVPIVVPGNNLRSIGRSTITKVSSPFQNASELNRNENKNLSSEIHSSKRINDSHTVTNESDKLNDDNAFNWYFQHYNDSHIDPYLGDVYAGVDSLIINQWTFLGSQMIIALWSLI
ncbi:protein artichoke [Leptopilina boulardi]|uniref:protein artichoke n=1 Tax=Leptopilina boulardi TaxID=63433 RepID=UPI0021F67A16|nr:protein artichoke [Leptopilina boulardi]